MIDRDKRRVNGEWREGVRVESTRAFMAHKAVVSGVSYFIEIIPTLRYSP